MRGLATLVMLMMLVIPGLSRGDDAARQFWAVSRSSPSWSWRITERPATPVETVTATLILDVPTSAAVWLQGELMGTTGARREFVTPPLPRGASFDYLIRVRDIYGDEETRRVSIRAGETVRQNFRLVPIQTTLPPVFLAPPPPYATMPMMGGLDCGPGG